VLVHAAVDNAGHRVAGHVGKWIAGGRDGRRIVADNGRQVGLYPASLQAELDDVQLSPKGDDAGPMKLRPVGLHEDTVEDVGRVVAGVADLVAAIDRPVHDPGGRIRLRVGDGLHQLGQQFRAVRGVVSIPVSLKTAIFFTISSLSPARPRTAGG